DAVDAGGAASGELPGAQDPENENECGQGGGLETRGEALDDVRRVARDGRPRGLLDGREAGRGVVVGEHEQQGGDPDPDQRAEIELPPGGRVHEVADVSEGEVAHQPVGDWSERGGGDHAGDDQALVEGPLDVSRARADREGADDRRDYGDPAEHEGINDYPRGL